MREEMVIVFIIRTVIMVADLIMSSSFYNKDNDHSSSSHKKDCVCVTVLIMVAVLIIRVATMRQRPGSFHKVTVTIAERFEVEVTKSQS